jgi:hypothetical protein
LDPTDIADNFLCFEMPLLDPSTKVQVGTGIDCLDFGTDAPGDDQATVIAYSFFSTPGGTLLNRGLTSVRAFVPGVGDGGEDEGMTRRRTHMTGSIPDPNAAPSLVGGTKRFKNKVGSARVSGAVDLDGPGLPLFDCMWVIDFD